MNIKLYKLLLRNEENDDLYIITRIMFYFMYEFLIIIVTLLYILNNTFIVIVVLIILFYCVLIVSYDFYLFVGRYTLDKNGEIQTIIFKRDLDDYEVFSQNSFNNLLAVYVENQEVVKIEYKGKEIDINTIKIIYFDDNDVDIPDHGYMANLATIFFLMYVCVMCVLIMYENFLYNVG